MEQGVKEKAEDRREDPGTMGGTYPAQLGRSGVKVDQFRVSRGC